MGVTPVVLEVVGVVPTEAMPLRSGRSTPTAARRQLPKLFTANTT